MVLKHKNMKDVAAWVLNPDQLHRSEPSRVKVRWLNTTSHKPFLCCEGIEEITIRDLSEWKDVSYLMEK